MNKEFQRDQFLYRPGSPVIFNGRKGHIWKRWVSASNGLGWLHDGQRFYPLKATRAEISLWGNT